jgi:hypothetical protein
MRTGKDSLHGFLLMIVLLTVVPMAAVVHAQSLPGDEILGYRVVDISKTPEQHWQWHVKLEVSYTYHSAHQKVIVGAILLPEGGALLTGFSYWGYESQHPRAVEETYAGLVVRGMQRIEIAVRLNAPEETTNALRLFLYTPQGNEFLSRTFPFQRSWRLADLSPASPPGLRVVGPPADSTPGPSPGTVKRTILQNGVVLVTYPDGTIKKFSKGGVEVVRPDGTGMRSSYVHVQPAAPPPQPTDVKTVTWLHAHAKALLDIISAMVGNDQTALENYLEYEGGAASDYERVNKRTETIGYLLAP